MKKLTFSLTLVLLSFFVSAQRTLIYAGSLIDGFSKKVTKEQTIIVDGKKIVQIKSGYLAATSGDKVVDLKSSTVMPGWIDLHVHVEGETSPDRYIREFTQNPADILSGRQSRSRVDRPGIFLRRGR